MWLDPPFAADEPIAINGDTTHLTIYLGPSEHVANETGSELSTPVACVSDLQLVQ